MLKKLIEIKKLKKHIEYKKKIFREWKKKKITDELIFLADKLNSYKGIIVYSEAIKWEPVQRPHHLLREFAKKNYLCFFCEYNDQENYVIKEMYKNVYLINGEEKLIPLLKNNQIIFLITYFLQYIYANCFDKKLIWFDVVDRLDFLSLYNSYSKQIYNEIIKKAHLVTYTSNNLKKYINNRLDAKLLPNAVTKEDFILEKSIVPNDMEEIVKDNKKILGYFGVVDEWFDFNIIKKIDETNKYNIVIIGKICNKIDVKKYNYHNVYFLEEKKHELLKYYSSFFDIGIIPFIINKITNAVSPVKFYEYMALNLPTISTNIFEMRNISTPVLEIVDENNLINKIEKLLNLDKNIVINETNVICKTNSWYNRVAEVEGVISNEQ